MNDFQKQRFVERVISAMFNTISKKKLAIFGFAFKKDTGDTRETPAIDVCRGLMADGANVGLSQCQFQTMNGAAAPAVTHIHCVPQVCVYDPEVADDQIYQDLGTEKFEWDHPSPRSSPIPKTAIAISHVRGLQLALATAMLCLNCVSLLGFPAGPLPSGLQDPMDAARDAHGICILTEWDCFKSYDYQAIYDSMVKPAFIFDGRNILDHNKLRYE